MSNEWRDGIGNVEQILIRKTTSESGRIVVGLTIRQPVGISATEHESFADAKISGFISHLRHLNGVTDVRDVGCGHAITKQYRIDVFLNGEVLVDGHLRLCGQGQ